MEVTESIKQRDISYHIFVLLGMNKIVLFVTTHSSIDISQLMNILKLVCLEVLSEYITSHKF